MAKGLAVISGVNSIVFKALEDGTIELGSNVAANVVVSGTLKLKIDGYGVDKFLMSDASGSASWVTIQASQVAVDGGSNVQAALDALEANVGGDLESIQTRLSAEEVRATSAEASLQAKITNEVSSLINDAVPELDTLRELAEALNNDPSFIFDLSSSLSTEISTRASADASLNSKIDALDSDLSLELSSAISAEASSRAAGDAQLSSALAAEASSRASADTSLEVRFEGLVSAEASSRQAADTSLAGALAEAISSEASSRAAGDAELSSALAVLEGELDAEVVRALSVEASLAARITEGTGDSLSAAKSYTDQRYEELVGTAPDILDTLGELAAAIAEDGSFAVTIAASFTAVNNALSTEVSTRASADTVLSAAISSEAAAREAADAVLSSAISAEAVARANADTSLDQKIISQIGELGDNTITFTGSENEVTVNGVTGSVVVTLGDQNSTITLGLPDSVTVAQDLVVTHNVDLGTDGADQITVNGKMRVPVFTAANVPSEYKTDAANMAGHMFYLQGAGDADFPQGNKWYFNENGVWHASFFYVG